MSATGKPVEIETAPRYAHLDLEHPGATPAYAPSNKRAYQFRESALAVSDQSMGGRFASSEGENQGAGGIFGLGRKYDE